MDFFDMISGSPCVCCESEPQLPGDLYCSPECRAEDEGEDLATIIERFPDYARI